MARAAPPPPPVPPPMRYAPGHRSPISSSLPCPTPALLANNHRHSGDRTVERFSSNSSSPRSTILLKASPEDSILGRALQNDEPSPFLSNPSSPVNAGRKMSDGMNSNTFSRASYMSCSSGSSSDSSPRSSKAVSVPVAGLRYSNVDPEKALDVSGNRGSVRVSQYQQYSSSIGYFEEERSELKEKALSILIYLACPSVLVSIFVLFYTLISLILIAFLLPVNLFRKGKSIRQQFIDFLAPSLRLQLCLVYGSDDSSDTYNVPLLLLIHLLSPVVSVGVAVASWVSAVFWFYAGIIGDPNGTDRPRGYNDGKASVLKVRAWWLGWLSKPLRYRSIVY